MSCYAVCSGVEWVHDKAVVWLTCGVSCCGDVGGGGGDGAVSGAPSHRVMTSWSERIPGLSAAPWSSVVRGDMTEYTTSTGAFHPPTQSIWEDFKTPLCYTKQIIMLQQIC